MICQVRVCERLDIGMIDWDAVNGAEREEQLKAAKHWLFQENVRLENERRELEQSREKFLSERIRFQKELEELNKRTVMERKRLREENLFFDKKFAILQDGFRKLEEDRQALERKKKQFAREQANRSAYRQPSESGSGGGPAVEDIVRMLFRGVNNPLALRKRYRDLMKIFHPDNLFGDEELVQIINKEYIRRKREE